MALEEARGNYRWDWANTFEFYYTGRKISCAVCRDIRWGRIDHIRLSIGIDQSMIAKRTGLETRFQDLVAERTTLAVIKQQHNQGNGAQQYTD